MVFNQKMLTIITVVILIAGLGIFLTVDGKAMGKFSKLVLFSHVEGVITKDGAPVEGAEIVQEIIYKEVDNVAPTSVQSGADGSFVFEEVSQSSGISRMVPGEATITQRLVIRHDGNEYEAWRHGKKDFEPNSELDGKPLRLVCELTTAPDFEGFHYGICRVAPDQQE